MGTQSNIVDNLLEPLERYLQMAGIYYRAFARRKSSLSIKKKLEVKQNNYIEQGKKMQDFVGIRLVFYFLDDVNIFHQKLQTLEGYDVKNEANTSTDLEIIAKLGHHIAEDDTLKPLQAILPIHDKVFMPQRLNIVMKMPDSVARLMEMELPTDLTSEQVNLIDSTYEVQLRTVLSEGWHEVEHDLRYKSLSEDWWDSCREESRQLNGIYASLEANEMALLRMIDGIAYKNYKGGSWDAMIRNHFRLRFNEIKLSENFQSLLDGNKEIAKQLLRIERAELINWIWSIPRRMPLTTNHIMCLANRKKLKCEEIYTNEPSAIKTDFDAMGI